MHWQILIDTGGTFTDCLASDPQGQVRRTKVLSNSTLKGVLTGQIDAHTFKIQTNWQVNPMIFEGYELSLAQSPQQSAKIAKVDHEKIVLETALPIKSFPQDFVITAHEEAPILAARIVTETPLHTALPPIKMRLGSTKGTNALLERKGAKVALLITKGFADLLEIGTQQRPHIFSLDIEKIAPIYQCVLEIDERIDATGKVLIPLTEVTINSLIHQLQQNDIEAVTIACMHSYLNPLHEELLAQKLTEAGITYISSSALLTPSIRMLPRTETAIVNAYLAPIIHDYLHGVKQKLSAGELKVMSSAGGLAAADTFTPKDSLLSGPAGGVIGASGIAKAMGSSKIITLDMGGTSTDVARFDEQPTYRFETKVGDAHILSPSLAIETVAAGGGSICSFDGQKFAVGPESAGAYPGPACYGAGGPLTITDINLLLGKVDAENFSIPIKLEAAQQALAEIQSNIHQKTGKRYTEVEILHSFLQIANEKMASAIETVSVHEGYSIDDYSLLAFGGAGGMHACLVAELLEIQKVLIPYDAGILSAYGMGEAVTEKFVTKQILKPLADVQRTELDTWLDEMGTKAISLVQAEVDQGIDVQVNKHLLFLRFLGQDSTLEISYQQGDDIITLFKEKYEQIFGHWVQDRVIELESARVIATTQKDEYKQVQASSYAYLPKIHKYTRSYVDEQWQRTPIILWDDMEEGAIVAGPAVILNQTGTTFIEAKWHGSIDANKNLTLTYHPMDNDVRTKGQTKHPEVAQLELFTNRFRSIAENMGALLQRTAFSVNVKERLDFSCALLDAKGELIVNAPHIPVHLGSLGICVRSVLAHIPIEKGDVVITNHPGFGGSHLPDITLISAVYDDQDELVGYVANRAHHAELGGKRPGSMPPDAADLSEEGVVITPTYLVKGGEVRWNDIQDILAKAPYPSRSITENMADLNAALASIHSGCTELQALCSYGTNQVKHYMQALKNYTHQRLKQQLNQLPQGVYQATEQLDDGSVLKVNIHLDADGLSFDFTGTASTHPKNLNATPAIVNSTIIYVLRLILKEELPLNEGLMQSVKVTLPKGCMLNPEFPADLTLCPAVVGGNTETSQRLTDTLLKAFDLAACSQGTMNNFLFGNDRFGYYETIGGGTGAGAGFHGSNGVHQHMTNTKITDPEVLELRYPVRLNQFGLRKGSGGKGQWHGGDGIVRAFTFLEPLSVTILAQHRKEAPYGMNGGESGTQGKQYIIYKDGSKKILEGVAACQVVEGDQIVIETPGGGGFGLNGE